MSEKTESVKLMRSPIDTNVMNYTTGCLIRKQEERSKKKRKKEEAVITQ